MATTSAPTTRDAAPGRTRKARATRAKLVAAAHEVFGRTGYDQVKVTDITEAARVASGTFYNYFTSKEEIFREVAAAVLDELWRAPQRHPDNPEDDPVLDVAWATRRFFETCLAHRRVLRSIELLNASDTEVSGTRHQALARSAKRAERWIARLQADGTCDPSLDPWLTAVSLHAMNVSMGYDHFVLRDEPTDVDQLVDAVTRVWAKTTGLE